MSAMSLPSFFKWPPFTFLLLFAAVGIGCHKSPSSVQADILPVAPVVMPQRAALSNRLEVAGELLPYQEVELHAKVSGYIRNIYVDIGDRVRKGQVLADLEIPELVAQVDEAQSTVQRSQQDILRAKSAVARAEADHSALHAAYQRLKQAAAARPGLIAQQELDDAQAKDSASEAQVDVAKADFSAMQEELGAAKANHEHYASLANYAHITAPYAGVVTWRYSDTGALVQAGTSSAGAQPVVKLAQTDILRLRVPVPDTLAGYVRIGTPAQIRIESTGQQLTGKVVRATGELDLATRTLQVEIDLNNTGNMLDPGMYADVSLDLQRSGTALTVPIQAVDRSGGRPAVLVVDNQGRIERREVILGLESPSRVEVLSGLTDSDRVVAANLASFTSGEAVHPQTVELPQYNPNGGSGED
jgi:RND family efflux transporter MFP subunit